MTASKIMNDADSMLSEALSGLARAHVDLLEVDLESRLVLRRVRKERGKVALLSGGGSGHEPMHAGFVGTGMLDAACPGEVFTSPTPDQMLAATERVDGGAGVLYIVKNYAGDLMNFEMAADMAAVETGTVVVADDVALLDLDTGSEQGHRGVAGTVVLEKLVGAIAERGADMAACADLAARIGLRTGSMAVALGSCTVPAVGTPTFAIRPGEMELGVGIHGEAGRARMELQRADAIAATLLDAVLAKIEAKPGDPLLLFCNGLGGTPLIEQYLLFDAAARNLEGRGLTVARSLVGPYCTALEMPGASLTVVRLDDEMISYWDDPVLAPALRWG